MKKKRRKNRSKAAARTMGISLLMALMILAALLLYKHYTQMVQIAEDGILWEDASRWTLLDVHGYSESVIVCEMDEELYISADYVNQEYAEEALFMDTESGRIYYTTPLKRNVFIPDTSTVFVDGEEYVYERIFSTYEGSWLVKLDWARQQFGMDININRDRRVVVIYPDQRDAACVHGEEVYLKKNASDGNVLEMIRGNTDGYAYYRMLEDNEQVICTETEGAYTKVLTQDGYMGYVETSALQYQEKQYTVNPEPVTVELPESRKIDGNVVLAWHQDYSGQFTEATKAVFAETKGVVDVISPTWFKFTDSGKLQSCANAEYVSWAHEQGYQIWALVDNDFADEKTQRVLKDEIKRNVLIEELAEACENYNLDGINVDFEAISEETAPYFAEFMRELSAVLRPAGYCLSVDVSVPAAWSSYYRRDLLARCCDYIIVMGYDEHYRGGGDTGSVSSMPWMESAADAMLELAEARKIILGVPFYTQLWSTDSEGTIDNEAFSMDETAEWLKKHPSEVVYDEEAGQLYAKLEEDGYLYEIWIENEDSMKKRLHLAEEKQLAGVAFWKMGMENDVIWNLVDEYASDRE